VLSKFDVREQGNSSSPGFRVEEGEWEWGCVSKKRVDQVNDYFDATTG